MADISWFTDIPYSSVPLFIFLPIDKLNILLAFGQVAKCVLGANDVGSRKALQNQMYTFKIKSGLSYFIITSGVIICHIREAFKIN